MNDEVNLAKINSCLHSSYYLLEISNKHPPMFLMLHHIQPILKYWTCIASTMNILKGAALAILKQ